VNILVLDTEVYSNTGGQASKATPIGRGGEVRCVGQGDWQEGPRPDGDELRNVYRRIDRAGRQGQRTRCKAMLEADAYPGPSLIIAYSHCIAHGYDLAHGC
jgi:pyruvate-ferredoxin/flavodoxin oxidoreductase